LAETGRFDAVVCLGCVIRGATPHFEYISTSVAHGIQDAAGGTRVPMSFGVLTTDTWEQAEERAGGGRDNKGFEAAAAAIEMAQLFRRLHPTRPAGIAPS
jgi:6,7-dimethyl-8-ribityllumazine synthase